MMSLRKISRLGAVLLAVLTLGLSCAPTPNAKSYSPYPQPDSGYVTDLADLLTRDNEEKIEQWLWTVEEQTGVEIAVVTIDSVNDFRGAPGAGGGSVSDRDIERFATGLFNKYGIGNMPQNNGVLLLVARYDRVMRIELGASYAHDRDDDAERIVQNVIIPHFKRDDYVGGVTAGVRAIMVEFADHHAGDEKPADTGAGDAPPDDSGAGETEPAGQPTDRGPDAAPPVARGLAGKEGAGGGDAGGIPFNTWFWGKLAAAVLTLFGSVSLFRNGKSGWGWVFAGLGIVLTLAIVQTIVLSLRTAGKVATTRGSSGSWSAGGFGGGFGGGFSGGGGATGRW
jgi:uncharacterized membrane protein YgcG